MLPLEVLNTAATIGTFCVIAASAIAALIQLRHLRSSNQIQILMEFTETRNSEPHLSAYAFVRTGLAQALADPAFRSEFTTRASSDPQRQKVTLVCNFYEHMGVCVKLHLIDRRIICDLWAATIVGTWNAVAPAIAISRRKNGPMLYENFEYLTVLAQEWIARYPNGTYPRNMRRIDAPDIWLEADTALPEVAAEPAQAR